MGCVEAHVLDLGPAALGEAGVWEGLPEAVPEGWEAEGHGGGGGVVVWMRARWVANALISSNVLLEDRQYLEEVLQLLVSTYNNLPLAENACTVKKDKLPQLSVPV